MPRIRDLPIRPYRRGVRFEHDPAGDKPAGVNLEDPTVKAAFDKAVEAATVEKKAEYDDGVKRIRSLHSVYTEEAKYRDSDWYKRGKSLTDSGKTPKIDDGTQRPQGPSSNDVEAHFARKAESLVEDSGFDASQAKGIIAILREMGSDRSQTVARQISAMNKEHAEELKQVHDELGAFKNDPGRLFREAEYQNPTITGDIKMKDAPDDIRARARELVRDYDMTPESATLMAFGEKGAKPYIESEKAAREKAESSELVPSDSGGLRGEGLPLPADVENAGLREFMDAK